MNWHKLISTKCSSLSLITEAFNQLLVFALYFLALYLSSWVSNHLETVAQSSAIYLPAGVKLAFFVIFPVRFWPMLWIASRLYASYLGVYYNDEWSFDLFHGFFQELTYMAIVYSFKKSRWPPNITSNSGALSLILLAVFSASFKWFLFSSAFEFTTWLEGKQVLQYQLNMTLGDLTGTLLVAPALLLINQSYSLVPSRHHAVILLSLLALASIYIVSYLGHSDLYPLLRLCSLLPVIWFSYKFGIKGAIASALVSNALIVAQAGLTQDSINTYISQLFILANSVTGLLVGTATNELKIKNNQLQASNEKLTALLEKNKQLAKRMVTVQENERKYLSQELHDELGQNLTALKTDLTVLSIAQRNNENALVEGLKENAKAMYDSVYQIMHHLRPRELDELGLEQAFKEGRFKSLLSKASIKYVAEINLSSAISDEHQTAIYRICQEAVTNCIKHSTATELRLSLLAHEQYLRLTIMDNGKTKTTQQESGGYGLSFIEERVIALGGTCTVTEIDGFKIEVYFDI
ncbi:MASE1 domain-containing protein [Pseudoalteromonas shioyasakiensis]|uniref:MASE1 domain-containing protein n=1 Tax=Pseudoalteromonas shioyasakiensis TaxID=1190813 RepID=UPI001C3D7500|nr:MASE1 domain-containing protein [Pseudoalteromonas shioyasakiensis]